MKKMLKKYVLAFLGLFGLEIVRKTTSSSYINCQETLQAAAKTGLSLADYLDASEPFSEAKGRSRRIVLQMSALGLFSSRVDDPTISMLEIGAGTGKYLERMLPGNISRCEIYEIDKSWSQYLRERFASLPAVVVHEADGKTLKQSADASCDLVAAHGVFVYLPLLIMVGYLREAVRVLKPGGSLFFDVFSDADWSVETVDTCLSNECHYPVVLPHRLMDTVYSSLGLELRNEFVEYYGCCKTRYLLFQKV
ncbi:hypothetical protein FACS1894206_08670 [Deltaproteobacteria bacterium]|nr:hypothetical protein FACS1894206_08670 [Deltaproteobacteria bacterium]